MAYRAILSSDPKVGSFDEQRAAFSGGVNDRIVEFLPDEKAMLLNAFGLREGDILLMAHARVLGRVKEREKWLDELADIGVAIQLPGGTPMIYDTPEKKAAFHAEAVKPTGRPSAKQKRNRGRPRQHPIPSKEKLDILKGWWNTPMSDGKYMRFRDVVANAEQLLGHKVSRDFLKNNCGKSRGKLND